MRKTASNKRQGASKDMREMHQTVKIVGVDGALTCHKTAFSREGRKAQNHSSRWSIKKIARVICNNLPQQGGEAARLVTRTEILEKRKQPRAVGKSFGISLWGRDVKEN